MRMNSKLLAVGVAALAASTFANPAHALEVTLGRGQGTVFVWRDGDAMDEGFKLIQAGVHKSNPTMVLQLLSCAVPSGTKAVITDAGFATHTIIVVDGDNAGCRGDVVTEDVDRN